MRRGVGGVQFNAIADNLILGNGSIADPYMCLADFDSYVKAQKRVDDTYLNKKAFNKMSLMNIANAGFFSADRAGIGQQLLFIEALGVVEGLLRRVSEQAVCLTLQGGKVIELWRLFRLFLLLHTFDEYIFTVTSL